ncbi:MAG: (2Fe-2S) ferredoxin domain-containing protein [Waterburya sp.]
MSSEIQLPLVNKVDLSQQNLSKEKVVVCRGRSCRKYNAEQVFSNFQQNLPPDVELMSVPCLGQCGNGTMVVVEFVDQTWYSEVHPDEVETIIKQHIIGKSPVKAMLYRKFHKNK